MDSICSIVPGAREKRCGGKFYVLDQGQRSILYILLNRTNRAVLNESNYICLNHWNLYIRPLPKQCFSPNCTSPEGKFFYPVAKRYNTYLDIHSQAQVYMHSCCYQQFKTQIDSSQNPNPPDSYNNNNNNNNNNNDNNNDKSIILPEQLKSQHMNI
jgi:hypothetical protein